MKIVYGQEIPDNMWTYEELGNMIGFTSQYMVTLCKKLGLKAAKSMKSNTSHLFYVYDDDARVKILEYARVNSKSIKKAKHIKLENKDCEAKQESNKLSNLEKLRKAHPLVKDDRFFIESYFPDVTLRVGEAL